MLEHPDLISNLIVLNPKISSKETYPDVSRRFRWKSCGCADLSIPISGVKQLGALTTLLKNDGQNTFQNLNTWISLYMCFPRFFKNSSVFCL